MKNLFGYNVNAPDERADGEEFVLRRIDGDLFTKQKELEEEGEALKKSSDFPPWLSFLKYFILMAGFVLLGLGCDGFSNSESLLGRVDAGGLGWVIGVGVFTVLVGLALFLLEWRRGQIVKMSSAYRDFTERQSKFNAQSREELHVPGNAAAADVFAAPYKPSPTGRDGFGPCYLLAEVAAFREGDLFCVSDAVRVFGIPLDKIRRVLRVKKTAAFVGWNKAAPPKKMPCKLRSDRSGTYFTKPYYAVEIAGSEDFYLLFPPYEWGTVAPLLGDSATKIEEVKKLS